MLGMETQPEQNKGQPPEQQPIGFLESTVYGLSKLLTKDVLLSGSFIAAATALGYLVTFLYEYGHADFYHLPTAYITPTLTTVFIVSIALYTLILTSIQVWFPMSLYYCRHQPPFIQRLVLKYTPAIILFMLYSYAYPSVWTCVLTFFILAYPWVTPFLYAYVFMQPVCVTTLPTYKEKLTNYKKYCERYYWPLLQSFSLFTYCRNIRYLIYLYVPLFCLGIYLIGYTAARNHTSYSVLDSQPNRIIIATYADTLVTARVDFTTNTIYPEFTVINTREKPISFHLVESPHAKPFTSNLTVADIPPITLGNTASPSSQPTSNPTSQPATRP